MPTPPRPPAPGAFTPRPIPAAAAAPRFRTLPENASTDQIIFALHEGMTAYANLACELPAIRETIGAIRAEQIIERDDRRRLEQAMEDFRSELVILRADHDRVDQRVRALEGLPTEGPPPPLPPMRERYPSSSDIAKHAGQEVAAKFEADLTNPSTPPPNKEKVAAISQEVIEQAANRIKEAERRAAEAERNRIKAEMWDKVEEERKRAEADRLASQRENENAKNKTKWALILGGGTAAISTVVAVVEHFLRVAGH